MLDKIDRKLLALLQQDCTLSLQALAEAVNLTTTLLEASETAGGRRYSYRQSRPAGSGKIGLGLTAFVLIKRNITAANGIAALSRWLPKCQKCWGSGAWPVNTII